MYNKIFEFEIKNVVDVQKLGVTGHVCGDSNSRNTNTPEIDHLPPPYLNLAKNVPNLTVLQLKNPKGGKTSRKVQI